MRRPIFVRVLILFLGLLASASAFAQSQLPPAIPQLRANPAGGRFALEFPAVPPATQRVPTIYDDQTKGYAANNYWFDPVSGNMYQALYVDTNSAGWAIVQPPPKAPLDGYSPAPALAYGMYRFNSTYVGPAVQVRRTDTLATQDIGFLQDGWVDQVAGDKFCAGTTCEISIAYDQIGTCNGTGANGFAPFWDNSKRINGHMTISFNSINHNISPFGPPESQAYLTIPNTCLTWTPSTSSFLMAGINLASASSADEYSFLSTQDGAQPFLNTLNGKGIRFGASSNIAIPSQPSVWTVAANASNFRVWNNNNTDQQGHSFSGAYTGAYLGWDGGAHYAARMWLQGFMLWTSTIGTIAEPQIPHLVEQALGYQRQRDNVVIEVGASNDTGSGEGPPGDVNSGNTLPNIGWAGLTPGTTLWNNSSHGGNLTNTYSNRDNIIGFAYTSLGGSTARNFVVVLTMGGNDIRTGATLAQLQANVQNFSTYVKSLGSNARFVIGNQLFACDFAADPTQTAVVQAYNNWLYSSATLSVAQGGAGADALFDRFGDAFLAQGAYVTSEMCINSVSYDGVHLKMPYQMSQAQRWLTTVNSVLK